MTTPDQIQVHNFNSTVVDMLNDLASALPSFTDLTIVATLASGMLRLDPNNTTLLDTFYPTIVQHAALVDTRDEATSLQLLKGLIPSQYASIVNRIWEQLTPENKVTIWDYIDILREQAQTITGAQSQTQTAPDLDKIPESSQLFLVYRSVWKEFITLLKDQDQNQDLWDQCLKTIADTRPCDLHAKVKEALDTTLPHVETSRDVLNVILPKDQRYMQTELDVDIARLPDSVPFVLAPSISFQNFVRTVKSAASAGEVPVYWHYMKVLTSVLASCPPEMINLLVSSCSTILGSGEFSDAGADAAT